MKVLKKSGLSSNCYNKLDYPWPAVSNIKSKFWISVSSLALNIINLNYLNSGL